MKMKNKLIFILFIIIGVLSIGFRAWWGSTVELYQAESALQKKEYPSSVIHYEKVILWNFPFFDYKNKAIKGIHIIQERAQAEDNQVVKQYAKDSLAFALASTEASHKIKNHSSTTLIPNRFWSAIVGLSLLTWIGITFLLIVFSFDNNMSLRHKTKFIFTLCILTFFLLLWILSIRQL